MNRNLIESLIEAQTAAYRDQAAADSVRHRVRNRRIRNASFTGAGAFVAVGALAAGATQVGGWGGGFQPASWAPAPNPYLPDAAGDGQARVPLPNPPQPRLASLDDLDTGVCPAFAPPATSRQGHATARLAAVTLPEDQAEIEVSSESGVSFAQVDGLVDVELTTTTGAATSVRVSPVRLYFIQDGFVKLVLTTWGDIPTVGTDEHPEVVKFVAAPSIQERVNQLTPSRVVTHLGGDTPTQMTTFGLDGGVECLQNGWDSEVQQPYSLEGEYQVVAELHVIADEQSAAQLHLMDEGVDLGVVTGHNGTLVRLDSTTSGRTYEAIDVTFPAEYLQDQFDEVIVTEPITVTMPDDWPW